MLHYVAHTGSRELFRLAVLAIALGVAFGASELFDISFALGAFLAGMILAESQLSQRAAQETLPLRDAFAVLFFVSVGMLFDPTVLLREPVLLAATFLIIVLGNAVAVSTLGLMSVIRSGWRSRSPPVWRRSANSHLSLQAWVSGSSFCPEAAYDLILAGAILSILINPLLFAVLARLAPLLETRERKRISRRPCRISCASPH